MIHIRKNGILTRSLVALMALVLLIGLLPMNVLAAEGETAPVWEQGTIASATGLDGADTTRIRTMGYLQLSGYAGVSVSSGYTMTNFAYDKDYNFLGTSGWLGSGVSFTTKELQLQYPSGVYFRIAVRSNMATTLSPEDLPATGVTFYAPDEDVPQANKLVYTDVMTIGTWQEGAIWNDELFLLGAGGTGAVYNLTTETKLGGITLTNTDVLKPHANSVCFGSTYYAEGDKYPLLYVSIYNNYASAADRMEGTCCVYRIMEVDGAYTGQLVQVIEIGFTEELSLWKSLGNNGDVRPYGNFVVDTDSNTLYAYTMRDKERVTRFFRFDIPALTDGDYDTGYGCNVVTLTAEDIVDRFDTEYFNYLQGVAYCGGKLISAEGISSADNALRVLDLETQTVESTYPLNASGLTKEPEVVCVDAHNNVYYAAADGILRKLELSEVPTTAPEPLAGKTVSILGASISTYAGISNNAQANSTIGSNAVYYTEGRYGVYANDTWWMQAVNDLGLRLLVNNSWSGSSLLYERSGTVGAYVNRCVQLHNNEGENPDIIAIQMGTNDFQYYKDTLGTADIDYDTLITNNGDGTYTYATPVTSLEAAAIVLHKISVRYPKSEVYYLNISQRVDDTDELIRSFNAELKQVVEHFGAHIVDIYGSAITMDEFDTYIGDGRVHPNKLGMDAYAEAFKRALVENTQYIVDTHTVQLELNNVTADYGDDKIVVDGDSFAVNLTAADSIAVSVTMGGTDITASAYQNGTVSIAAVTDDVAVTANSVHEPKTYRWEFDGSELVSAGETANVLTKTAGTTTDGVFNKTCYTLTDSVVLSHDQPWAVEWKAEGTWKNTGGSGARLFTTDAVNANYNARYIFKSSVDGLIAMGEKDTAGSHNYGIALADHGIDANALHTYRLENHINADGSNMVYLLVDGKEIGPMTGCYLGTTAQNTTSDWLSGKDFVFPYMGTDTHGLTNCSIDYIEVRETGDKNLANPVIELTYDDRYDGSGKTVEILDAGIPTSYQVGYGVEENTVLDSAVVTLDGNTLIATGIGTAKVLIDGQLYEVTVTAAPISLLLLAGQSNMQGSEGDANQSIVCPDGMVYSTYGDRYTMTVENATNFAPSALTGSGSAVNVNGTTDSLSDWPVYLLNEAGAGKAGPDSGFAYEWVKQTGEKVWIVNAAHGGSSITTWQDGGANYEEALLLFSACQETLRKEIAAGHFTLSHMGYFWCQGCTDETQTAEWYVKKYLTMHELFKTEMAFDHDSDPTTADKTFEFSGIIPIRSGHQNAGSYRAGTYTDTTSAPYFESFKDLRMNGPRVAQYWMGNNPELTDIWNVCTIQEGWATMPDGSDGVAEYFNAHYPNGTVDYTTQVQQKASWYTPTTPKNVHDSIHYNQIGYNEVGRESVRNALVNLGEIAAPETTATVKLVGWDGFTEVESVSASNVGNSGTLVVPMVEPVYLSKTVTYEVSDGLNYTYYDLLADNGGTEGSLTAIGANNATVTVTKTEPGELYADHLSELPEIYCGGTDLWKLLAHDAEYFMSGSQWGIHSSGKVYSVTVPAGEGDQIWATSFGKAGENGGTSNGIRVTFFGDYGVVKTMVPADVYAEFSKNGYLTAPAGTTAVNVPMWTNDDTNELYLLSAEHDYESVVTAPTCTEQGYTTYTCTICGNSYVDSETETLGHTPNISAPTETEDQVCVTCGTVLASKTGYICVNTDALSNTIAIYSGQLIPETCEVAESDVYGYVVNYPLKKGHILSISDTNYVFSVRKLEDGNYSTMLKQATTASFTATEDMTVGMLIRKPDKSAVTAEELANIVIYDSQFGMIGVDGSVKRFTVEAETIDGGTATTRAAIFLPESYSDSGKPTRLIVMTNGYSAHLTNSVWNKNSAENVQVIQNYLNADYAVWVVDNTAASTSQTPDLGCPQLVDSYFKAYEYIQNNLNVEKKFSVHARSFGTFAAVRIMREHPELVKCAVMTGSRVSIKAEWPGIEKAHVAKRFGFTDITGATYEADKLLGYDPYTDVNDATYALPPTFWMLANGDSTEKPCEFIEKLTAHGNDVTLKIYSDISHTGICTLNTSETFADALAYLEKHQVEVHTHSYSAVATAPTCTEKGYTTHTCTICGDSYTDSYVPAKGYDAMLADKTLKLLLVGNSYSEDASNCGQGMQTSQLLNILQAMLGEDMEIQIGLAYSGGKSLAWHATQAEQGTKLHSLRVISTDGQWQAEGSMTLADALQWTDWDIVSLQPYGTEASTGMGKAIYADQEDEKFYPMDVSVPYLLDYTAKYAPQAEIYYYMIWSATKTLSIDAARSAYETMAAFTPTVLNYRGTESGARFSGIIPVGTAIQNARTTYLSELAYNTSAYNDGNLNLITDAQIGLQRDGGHLSFNIGRYIAALTFAETLIPDELRAADCTIPPIRITESVGELPAEYTAIAQAAVAAAVREDSRFAVTTIEGYAVDPIHNVPNEMTVMTGCATDLYALKASLAAQIAKKLGADFAVGTVSLPDDFVLTKDEQTVTAAVEVRFGYSSKTVTSAVTVGAHSYESVVTAPTCTEKGYTTHSCTICGDSYTDSYTDELGQYRDTVEVLPGGEKLVLTDHNVVMHNKCLIVSADIENLGKGLIRIGHGQNSYSGSYLEITADKLLVYSTYKEVIVKEYIHGLTIEGNVHVRIEVARSGAQVTITTQSGEFSQRLGWSGSNGEIFCAAEGAEMKNVDFRWYTTGLYSDVWMFGDSWFSTTSAARWPKYLLDDGYTDVLLGGYGGMGASAGLKQFRELLKIDVPEYAVWALGMNNGDRGGVINSGWLAATEEFLSLCQEHGVTPILCTIPHTPVVNNLYKNAWIRDSEYRYIDFDLAVVENHNSGDWFEGMAAKDLAHPTDLGAQTLYPQVFADFHELATGDSATCSHKLYLLGDREATCEIAGRNKYYVCSLCAGTYRDAAANDSVTKAEMKLEPTGHSYGQWIESEVPTCTAMGSESRSCADCAKVELRAVPAVGHTEVSDLAKAATCTETGLTEGKHCSVCSTIIVAQTVVPAKGHTAGAAVKENVIAATCTADGSYDEVTYCTVCKAEISRTKRTVSAVGHKDNDKDFECDVCKEDLCTEHNAVTIKGYAATCTADGLTDGSKCGNCGEIIIAQTVIPAKGHTVVIDQAVAETCTASGLTEGKHCSVCSAIIVAQTVVPAKGHTAGAAVRENTVAATCTVDGSYDEVTYCTVCKAEISRTKRTVSAIGHKDNDKDFVCDVCKEDLCTKHTAVTIKGYAATCTADGLTDGSKCSNCGEIIIAQTVIPAAGHRFDKGACTVCGATDPNYVAPTPTPVVTATPTPTPVVTPTPTPVVTPTPTPVVTATPEPTATPTPTPVVTATPEPTATPTPTPVVTATPTPVVTATPEPTATPTPTPVVTATPKPTATPTPTPVVTATPTPTPVVTATPKPTATPTPTPVVTVTPKPTATPTPTPVVTATPKPTATPTPTPVVTATPEPTATPTPTPVPTSKPEITFDNPFVDVSEGAYYYAPVLWAAYEGITGGTSETTFSPDATCTRGQVVTFLWRSAGSPEPKSTDNPFTDVTEADYFYTAVLWAVENGITAGTSATTFGPNVPCTRAHVATFLWRSEGSPEPKNEDNPFVDVAVDAYYRVPVLWAVENEVTSGVGQGLFGSDAPCTRGQIVTFLYKTALIPDEDSGIFEGLAHLFEQLLGKQ